MALAKFHQKAALSAAQAIRVLGHDVLASRLSGAVPGVLFDGAAARCQEGRTALELLVNLLARLYPHLELEPRDDDARGFANELTALARAINPEIEVGSSALNAHVCAAAVSRPVVTHVPVLYLGSDAWTARVGTLGPNSSGDSGVPFGASCAACLAAANLFRYFFRQELPGGDLDESAELSLLSMNTSAHASSPATDVEVGEWHLVGAGAVGSAALWTLKRATGIRGLLHVIDHDNVDLSNLQRYILFFEADVGRPKATACESLFADSSITIRGYAQTWGEYLANRADWQLGRIAVAVDSAAARVAVQASLPRRVLNAWTQVGDLGVSRHMFTGEDACLACMYLPVSKRLNEDEHVADALGIPDAVREIRDILYRNSGVPRQLLARAAAARNIPLDPLLRFEGKPLRTLYTEGVCGGLLLSLGASNGTPGPEAETPLAFQSAMAGVLLGAEIVLDSARARSEQFPTVTSIDLLKRFPDEIAFRRLKSPVGRCLCQDPDYIAQYCRKHRVSR